jgi:hypothetical protein
MNLGTLLFANLKMSLIMLDHLIINYQLPMEKE